MIKLENIQGFDTIEDLMDVTSSTELERLINAIKKAGYNVQWRALSDEIQNHTVVEMSSDPGSGLLAERVTNAEDAKLKRVVTENNMGSNSTRKEALKAFNTKYPKGNTWVHCRPGTKGEKRTISVRDKGIGLDSQQMCESLFSFMAGDKIYDHYLHGRHGVGGSTALGHSNYTMVLSKAGKDQPVVFSIVRKAPAKEGKIHYYQYMVDGENKITSKNVPTSVYQKAVKDSNCMPFLVEDEENAFEQGTFIQHVDVDRLPTFIEDPGQPASFAHYLESYIWDCDDIQVVHEVGNTVSKSTTRGGLDRLEKLPTRGHGIDVIDVLNGKDVMIDWAVFEDSSKQYLNYLASRSHPVVVTYGGQKHARLPKSLIKTRAGLSWLEGQTLVVVDITRLGDDAHQILTSDRQHLKQCDEREEIVNAIVDYLENEPTLLRINEAIRKQRTASIQNRRQAAQRVAKQVRSMMEAQAGLNGLMGGKRTRKNKGKRNPPVAIPPSSNPDQFEAVSNNHTVHPGKRKSITFLTNVPVQEFENNQYSLSSPSWANNICWRLDDGGHHRLVFDVENDQSLLGETANLTVTMMDHDLEDTVNLTVKEESDTPEFHCPEIDIQVVTKSQNPEFYGPGSSFEDDFNVAEIKPSKTTMTIVLNGSNKVFDGLRREIVSEKGQNEASEFESSWMLYVSISVLTNYYRFKKDDKERANSARFAEGANDAICARLRSEMNL